MSLMNGLSLLMHVIVTLFYLHSLYCTFHKCVNADAFILQQSFLKILAYQMLSVMTVLPLPVLGDLWLVRFWLLLILASGVKCYVLVIK
jgi:hypothetical protein